MMGCYKSKVSEYVKGMDGVPCTHTWDGTVLTISSASGTSSADLKADNLNADVIKILISVLRNATYSEDQTENIDRLETLLNAGDE